MMHKVFYNLKEYSVNRVFSATCIPTHPLIPLLSSTTIIMFTGSSPGADANFIGTCIEGFLYGKISVLCALTCTLAKEVQLLPAGGRTLFRNIRHVFATPPE
jgi:hypothetical protein